jgi:hypothetical protein
MKVERDDQGHFHVRGTFDDGHPGWGIQVWLKGSDQDGPEDHRYRVIDGQFHRQGADQDLSIGKITVTDHGADPNVDPAEKEAVLSLIAKWEERLPLIAPGAM